MKLAVCYPWSVPWISTGFTDAALNLARPDGCEVEFIRGEGWCSAARHVDMCEKAITWGATHICIIGSDQDHPRDMLVKLVAHVRAGCSCVTALVPMRGFNKRQGQKPFETVGWRLKSGAAAKGGRFDYTDFDHVSREEHGDLVEINAGGTGVLLFPVSALAKIPRPWFRETGVGDSFRRSGCADTPFITALQRHAGLRIYADTTIDVGHYHTFRVDRTFSKRFADWEEGGGDPSVCIYDRAADQSRIGQVRVSPSIPFYDEKFRRRYNLRDYDRTDEPAFFFGCYTNDDVNAVRSHRSTAVVIWAGSDVLHMRKALEGTGQPPFGPNVFHVAISNFIADDLDALGLKYKRLPLCCVDESLFQPTPTNGRKGIYVFLPDDDREKYGGWFIDELMPMLPEFDWVIRGNRGLPQEQMLEVYDRCFIGIRPVSHDGLSNSVLEMGLMGRKMLWNGDAPNAIGCTSFGLAAEKIRAAYRVINENGVDDYAAVARDMREWLAIPDGFKNVEYHVGTLPLKLAAEPYDYRRYFDWRYEKGPLGAGGPSLDSYEAHTTRWLIQKALRKHGCTSVLEVGCGSCARWKELPSENYIGVDVSPKAIGHALRKFQGGASGAEFRVLDVTKGELPQADAVLCVDVLQHIRPEDFPAVCAKLFAAARKFLFIKTSVNIPTLHYQFSHDWEHPPPGCKGFAVKVTDIGAPAMVFEFERINQEATVSA